MKHPSRENLDRFRRGRLSAAETCEILQHLVTGCAECGRTTAAFWDLHPVVDLAAAAGEGSADEAYDRVIDRVFRQIQHRDVVLQREAVEASELFAELDRHPFPHRLLLVGSSARFRSRGLCELLLDRCHDAGFQDPRRAIDLGHVAVAAAHRLPEDETPGEIVHGIQARAWAQLGNALRISGDHAGAEESFASADRLIAADPRIASIDRARVLDQCASLRRDQGRYGEAFRLLDRVIGVYRKLGQWHLLGRALAQKAMVYDEVGELEAEMDLLRQALDLLDPQADPRIFLGTRHNLILALNQSGRHREACALMYHTRPLYLEAGDRINLVRLRWLEGLLAAGLGRLDRAEAAFLEVRADWVELELPYDAALVSLDLAGIYALQGRTADMRRLAEEVLGIFHDASIHREALAALLVFHQAAILEEAGVRLVEDISRFLKRCRNNPSLQYLRVS